MLCGLAEICSTGRDGAAVGVSSFHRPVITGGSGAAAGAPQALKNQSFNDNWKIQLSQ